MIIYIWKIIDLPFISISDLEYKISFEFFLFSPKEAKSFIKKSIDDGFLLVGNDNNLYLSDNLILELKNWQIRRREEILKKISTSVSIAQKSNNFKKNGTNKFNILLKAFLDSGTINRAVLVLDDAISIKTFDPQGKLVRAEIKGSQKTPYLIEISATEKVLKHDCHDFQTKRAQNKKFCKHLAKLFLLLKEKDERIATLILENISKDINKWDFIF